MCMRCVRNKPDRITRVGWMHGLVVGAILVFATFPHIYQLYLDRCASFGPDEGRQISAAISLSTGLGYTHLLLRDDLASPVQVHLKGWPPGYSVALWGLHSLGLD